MVALGFDTAAAFTDTSEKLMKEVQAASEQSFEAVWHMPITDEHKEGMKGKYSDLNNKSYTGRFGGACTAAAFLLRFVEKDTEWVHLDIAGPA